MATTPRMSGASIAQVVVVVVVIVSIQLALPPSVTIGPIWMVPLLELTGIPIALAIRRVEDHEGRILRRTMDAYLILLVVACVMNAVLLLVSMLRGADESGVYLLFAGFGLYRGHAGYLSPRRSLDLRIGRLWHDYTAITGAIALLAALALCWGGLPAAGGSA